MKGGGDEVAGSGPLEHPGQSVDPPASGQYPSLGRRGADSKSIQRAVRREQLNFRESVSIWNIILLAPRLCILGR